MKSVTIAFAEPGKPDAGDLAILVRDDLAVAPALAALFPALADLVRRAAAAERFKGRAKKSLVVPAPAGLDGIERLVAVGIGPAAEAGELDWLRLGGALAGALGGRTATVTTAFGDGEASPEQVAALALGARLRLYAFDRYKTKAKARDEADSAGETRITFAVADPEAARAADVATAGLADGVNLARDLVNEPPNVLFPAEFARRAEALAELGVSVEVLGEDELRAIGMRALLAVGQGSGHGSRVALMRWNGGPEGEPPLAFVGKGVCFDSGGISIKPSGGMEDMKGDMAGAATVVGLMHALAARKAPVNALGAIGLTENMPDGEAQRPGDIITSLSGQTIEMVNSDAEGRLVLADVLWYVQDRFKPRLIVDLATLTGAVLVALGQENAGLFSPDDALAERLIGAGRATGETVWRLPLGPGYDKLIDSKFADMKNTGGRHGGSITAAQFLLRFIREEEGRRVPWAHLDIAGTGMNAPKTDINTGWSAGWGVRLLDRLVRDHYEG